MSAIGPLVALLVILGVPLVGVLALVLGIVALVRIGRSGGALRGRGLALAAIVLGGLMLLVTPVLLVGGLLVARGEAAVDHRAVRALEQARMEAAESARRAAEEQDRRVRAGEEARRKAALEEDRKRELEKQTPPPPPPSAPTAPPATAPAGR